MIRSHRCPVCDKDFNKTGTKTSTDAQDHFPFCSDRCKKIDFFRWCDGRYEIVEEVDPLVAEILKHDPDIHVRDEDKE